MERTSYRPGQLTRDWHAQHTTGGISLAEIQAAEPTVPDLPAVHPETPAPFQMPRCHRPLKCARPIHLLRGAPVVKGQPIFALVEGRPTVHIKDQESLTLDLIEEAVHEFVELIGAWPEVIILPIARYQCMVLGFWSPGGIRRILIDCEGASVEEYDVLVRGGKL